MTINRWCLGMVVVALLMAGCARGASDDLSVVSGGARHTLGARTFRFAVTVEFPQDQGGTLVYGGMADVERKLSWMGQGENPEPEMISDGEGTYLLAELMPREYGAMTAWVYNGPEDQDDEESPPFASFALEAAIPGQGGGDDPAKLLQEISDQGGRVEKQGQEVVRGAQTTRYRVHLDLDRLEAKARSDSQERLERARPEDRETFEAELRDALEHPPVLHVWVDDDELVRRIELRTSYADDDDEGSRRQGMVNRTEFFDFGAPFTVVVPSPSEVSSLSSLPGMKRMKSDQGKMLSPQDELSGVSNWSAAGRGKVGKTRWTLESGTSPRGSVCTRLRLDPPVLVPSPPKFPGPVATSPGGSLDDPPTEPSLAPPGPPLAPPPPPFAPPPPSYAPPDRELVESHTIFSMGAGCGFSHVHGSGGGEAFEWVFGEVPPGADAARARWADGRVAAVELHGVAWAVVGERPYSIDFLRKGRILRHCDLDEEEGMPC